MSQRVFVDANVLCSKTLRDWLFFLRAKTEGMFLVHSSPDVLAEAVRCMRERNPRLSGEAMSKRRDQIQTILDEVVERFSGELPFDGNDEGDYHVHAAATNSQADFLLTSNETSDFYNEMSATYEVIKPDDFFCLVADSSEASAEILEEICRDQIAYYSGAPAEQQLDESLSRAGCPKFGARVARVLRDVALTGR